MSKTPDMDVNFVSRNDAPLKDGNDDAGTDMPRLKDADTTNYGDLDLGSMQQTD